ncbi:hypothetical protein [Achromobacter aloeverae]|uniref:hypothetical protein n=1 Tax=Achromobacter aloeverae TaxID=1750518 RepID=UPI0013017C3F|nr:hypothetical protein [Achromobacter aloeverae]
MADFLTYLLIFAVGGVYGALYGRMKAQEIEDQLRVKAAEERARADLYEKLYDNQPT